MILMMFALAMAAPQCAAKAELPRSLASWSRSAEGLDTRHAAGFTARDGRIETQVVIRKAGVFGFAIDKEGWIDVAPVKGKAMRFVSQNRGPRCSGIQKIVRYRLEPGAYRVTVAKLREPKVRMMLVRGNAR